MKIYILIALVSGQIGLAHADGIAIQPSEQVVVTSGGERGGTLVTIPTNIDGIEKRRLEKREAREQIKDQLGLGELERMAVSGSEPRHEEVLKYRGAETDQLFSLLENGNFSGSWRVIAKTIGLVANEESARKLADFATTAFSTDSVPRKWHIEARAGAMSGLVLATRDQPMPWVREFLVSHSDANQWIEDFGEEDALDPNVAYELALHTMRAISRMANDESLAMLKEVRERVALKSRVQPASVGLAAQEPADDKLEHIDIMIKQTQELAKLYASHAEKNR